MTPALAQCLPLETARTRLRLLRPADLDEFHAYRSDPEVGRYQGWYVMDRAHAARFLQDMSTVSQLRADDWVQLAIADGSSDGLIGDVGVFHAADGHEAELGFSLARHWQGRGLATEAVAAAVALVFRCSTVAGIRAVTDVRNASSMRLLERLDFVRTLRQQSVVRGETCDEFVYLRSRKDGA